MIEKNKKNCTKNMKIQNGFRVDLTVTPGYKINNNEDVTENIE